ncbi:hypothetical protein NIES4102_23440 [Chondrocystis sp. NIES-4102]|nr:hypothetical protein NIES4102_23440 [Chondrocystis sp. NIES-4102]
MNLKNIDTLATSQLQETEAKNEPDIIIGSREQIFHLLAEAAEIEHTLMCSYLYAAFSLKVEDPNFSVQEAEAVKDWYKVILGVAIEEMGHLLSVSNLIVALGGQPHFTRPNFPVSSGYFPSDLVLRLTPFSLETLDHFIFIERPTGIEEADGEGFEGDSSSRKQAYQGLMPNSQDYSTVSHLYEALRLNLQAFCDRTSPEMVFIGPEGGQIGSEIIKMDGVGCISDLDSAMKAIDSIVEQGEGSPSDRADSHYHKFQGMKEEYIKLMEVNPEFDAVYPVAENPVMRMPAEAEGKVFIDAHPAAMVLDFANASYGMLLRFLVQSYTKSGTEQREKKLLVNAAIEMMHVLDKAAKELVKLPASKKNSDVHAGITFTMLDSIEPFIGGVVEKTLIVERLTQLAAGARKMKGSSGMSAIATKLDKLAKKFPIPSK